MNRLLSILIAALALLAPCELMGQNYPMLHYTMEDGLPSNNVYSVYKDSRGYMWIATDKGVARHNGIKFDVYSSFNGLPDNEVFFFKEDNYGRLWLGAFNGELCYFRNDSFHNAGNTQFLKRIPFIKTHTRHISVEKDSSIIISYNDPTKFLVIHNESCRIFDLKKLQDTGITNSVSFGQKLSANRYQLICKDRIVTIDTLYNVIEYRGIDERLHNQGSFTSCQDQEWLFNDQYFFTWDMKTVKRFPQNFASKYFLHEIYQEGKNIYYATKSGLFINDAQQILNGNNVSAITQDNKQNFWISTLNNGVFVLKNNYLNTRLYKDAYAGVAKYASAHDNVLFFATTNNNLFEVKNGHVNCLYNYSSVKGKPYDYPVDFGFYIDSNLSYFNFYDGDIVYIDNLSSPRPKTWKVGNLNGAKAVYPSGNKLYLKFAYYIARLDRSVSNKTDLNNAQLFGNKEHDRIFGMAKAPDNSIWYSTIDGIFRIDNNDTEAIAQRQFRGYTLKSFDFFGDYMVGYTHANGLLIFSNFGGSKVRVDSVSPRNCIWDKMYRIDASNILLSTNGFYRLLTFNAPGDTARFTVRLIDEPIIPLHAEAICTDGKKWYFLKNGAITEVDKTSLLAKTNPPQVFFTGLKTPKGIYTIGKEMWLGFNEAKNISILFSTLSFGGKNVQYQYIFSKNDQDHWIKTGGEEINLVNPVFGNYIIKIRAKTGSSDYCEPITCILHIERPYWAKLWFNAILLGMILIAAWLIIRYRIRSALRSKDKEYNAELKFMKSEYKALNALMNPHFIFNTLNNVQGLINRNDKPAANEYIRVFADLIRQNMHNISKDLIPLQKEMDLVNNYLLLEKLRFKEHLNFSVNADDALDLSEIFVPPLLVQPLVENSIKHGILPLESDNGFIAINIYERNGTVYIEVKDNGTGMQSSSNDKNTKHVSFGLENIRKRINHLSVIQNKAISFDISSVKDEKGKLQWTLVTIGIPYS